MWTNGIYIALSSVAVGISIAIAAILLFIHLKKRRNNDESSIKKPRDLVDVELQQFNLSVRTASDNKVSFEGSSMDTTTPRNKTLLETFTLEDLMKATEGFSTSNHIGGSVYHGRFGGQSLAIKITKLETAMKINFGLFQDGAYRHSNIVKLIGTCLDEGSSGSGSNAYLVFEYAKNGSLNDWIHHSGLAIKSQFIASCDCFLTWARRLRICLDVAMGLQYMHHIMSPCYIHHNIKARNIFLDEEFNAKLGNFGMKGCTEEDDQAYLAPELTHNDHGSVSASPSLDVYAFGVVLLEVLTGQAPVTRLDQPGAEEAPTHLRQKVKLALESGDAEGAIREFVDGVIGDEYPTEGALQIASLAVACTEDEPTSRPSAGEVAEVLLRMVEELPAALAAGENRELMSESSSNPLVIAAAAASDSNIDQYCKVIT